MTVSALTPQDLLQIAIRRKWLILGVMLVSLGLSWVAWKVLPKHYKSTVVITLDRQKVAQDYVRGLSREGRELDDPLKQLNQQVTELLLSRTALMEIIETLKPFGEMQDAEAEGVLKGMRRQITTEPSKDGAALSISFTHENPLMAQAVTATIGEKLKEGNLTKRERLAENTTAFLTVELDRAKADLEAREKTVSEFKRSHMGELPQQMEANLRALDRLQVEMFTVNETVTSLNSRLGMIEKAIKEYEMTGMPSTELPASSRKTDRRLPRLRELERNLASLSATYKQNYPDIVHLKEEIAKLKSLPPADSDEMVDDLVAQEGKSGGMKPQDPYLRELTRQRNEAKAEIASLKDRQGRLTAQVREYEGRVERTPTREQTLAVLVRDYENMQKNYQSLLDKKLSARIMENLERKENGEQFRIVDRANLPKTPEPPTKLQLMLAGLAVGCALGMGAALGLEMLKVGFRQPEEVEALLGLPFLAAIPFFESAFDQSVKSLPYPIGRPSLPPSGMRRLLMPPQGESRGGNGKLTNGRGVAPGRSSALNLVAKWRPMSVVAEQFRVAATRLVLMGAERSSTVLVVTSAVMGEGKSTTSINLGYVLARDLGKQTLLIDCDLKRPMLHAYAGVMLEPGLAKVLHGDKPIEDCLQQLDNLPLWILPAGSTARRSVELFKISKLSHILNTLRTRFEYIVLDAPPILPLADMNVLASMADVLALVVRAETTSRDVVQKAVKALKFPNDAGIILTGLHADWTPYYMQQEYYLGHDVERQA
jgi:polysaccharide chain length determinant protein (PEP-CTERM system associated)